MIGSREWMYGLFSYLYTTMVVYPRITGTITTMEFLASTVGAGLFVVFWELFIVVEVTDR